jgi:hypothetical protein
MARFACSKCGCVEDSALCHYWSARLRQQRALCSACDPAIARWHGEFAQESAAHWAKDQHGVLLWSRSEVEDWIGQPIEVIGEPASVASRAGKARTDVEQLKALERLLA